MSGDFMSLIPIGYVESCFKYKNGTPRQPTVCQGSKARITIVKSLYNNPEHALEGLEQFSHVWILFIFHKNNNVYLKPKVKPPRLNGRKVGVFSTRSPYRPNAVGLTLARIEKVEDATLHLSGIDMLDGSPVIDIKPYIPDYDRPTSPVSTMERADQTDEDGYSEIIDSEEDYEQDQSVDGYTDIVEGGEREPYTSLTPPPSAISQRKNQPSRDLSKEAVLRQHSNTRTQDKEERHDYSNCSDDALDNQGSSASLDIIEQYHEEEIYERPYDVAPPKVKKGSSSESAAPDAAKPEKEIAAVAAPHYDEYDDEDDGDDYYDREDYLNPVACPQPKPKESQGSPRIGRPPVPSKRTSLDKKPGSPLPVPSKRTPPVTPPIKEEDTRPPLPVKGIPPDGKPSSRLPYPAKRTPPPDHKAETRSPQPSKRSMEDKSTPKVPARGSASEEKEVLKLPTRSSAADTKEALKLPTRSISADDQPAPQLPSRGRHTSAPEKALPRIPLPPKRTTSSDEKTRVRHPLPTERSSSEEDSDHEDVKPALAACAQMKRPLLPLPLKVETSEEESDNECFEDNDNEKTGTMSTNDNSPIYDEDANFAAWIRNPPISQLNIRFTSASNAQLLKFDRHAPDSNYRLNMFETPSDLEKAIQCILQADPRSTYRREKCSDKLYFFVVDTVHVTCWFDKDVVEVLRVQPASVVHPKVLGK